MPAPVLGPAFEDAAMPRHCASSKALVGDRPLIARLKAMHQKASRALILGQGSIAWTQCLEAIQYCNILKLTDEYGEQQARQLCCRLWILYICVLSSMTEVAEEDGKLQLKHRPKAMVDDLEPPRLPTTVRQVWDLIMDAFGGYAGNVDSEVLVPTVLLCLKLRDAKTARNIVEAWLATLSDDTMYLLQSHSSNGHIGGAERQRQQTMAQASYLRVCELYTLHILPQLGDLPSAYDFLSMTTAVPMSAKNEFTRRLDTLRTPAPAAKKKKKTKHRLQKPKKPSRPRLSDKTQLHAESTISADGSSIGNLNGIEKEKPVLMPLTKKKAFDKEEAKETPMALSAAKPSSAESPSRSGTGTNPDTCSYRQSSKDVRRTAAISSHAAVKSHTVSRRPRSIASIAWHVVRRLLSRWGFTLLTLAIITAVLRMVSRRFRLPPFISAVYRKLWNTVRMGTQVTYL
ncbi:hypothetical protein GGH99_004960 [Coemansia sp. RSA 1285]|nr:hypothetical protein GGH99_004960 [Coemansia sp. RSA 1285]